MQYYLRNLQALGKKVTSQNGEDGVIEAIFTDIPPRSKYFVEFGVGPNWQDPEYENGLEGNCVLLRKSGWRGLFMDGGNHPPEYEIKKEYVTPLNINRLLRKYSVPHDLDVLSIDVDGQDFWIWMACQLHPTLVIIEYNPNWADINTAVTIEFDLSHKWDGTKYFGASLGAMAKLGSDKGYVLVHANGVNAFFVAAELISNPNDFLPNALIVSADQHRPDHLSRRWIEV